MTTAEAKKDPEFLRLEKELGELQVRMHALMQEVREKFPPREGFDWSMNAANTLGQYGTHRGE